jgi:hypothetical protein
MKRRKRCCHCGKLKSDVIRGYCATCESEQTVWCEVCQERMSQDDECRHLVWTDFGYAGAGSNECDYDDCRASFLSLLTATVMAHRLLPVLVECRDGWNDRSPLRATYFGTTFGADSIDVYLGNENVGDIVTDAAEDDERNGIGMYSDDGVRLGIGWLVSICPTKKTRDRLRPAIERTIGWVNEWLESEDRRATLLAYRKGSAYV